MKNKLLPLISIFIILLFSASFQLSAQQNQLLIERPISGANHLNVLVDTAKSLTADFFVHDQWMRTYSAAERITYSNSTKSGVADKLNIKDGEWILDSVQFYMTTIQPTYSTAEQNNIKVKYETPKLDSLQIQIWDGIPFAAGSTLVWGDANLEMKCSFTTTTSEVRYAERYLNDGNKILWKFQDTCKLFNITATLPKISLSHGEYYIAYLLKSSYLNDTNVKFGAIEALMYNSESPYSEGSALRLNYSAQKPSANRLTQENKDGLSLAMNIWGTIVDPWENDLTISDITVEPSCDMSKASVKLKIKNLGLDEVNINEGFKLYYSVDNPESSWSQVYVNGDTIESKLDFGSVTSIPVGSEVELQFLAPKGSDATTIDMAGLGLYHRVRAWIVWEGDDWTPNNLSQLVFRNPGANIADERLPGEEVRYSFSFPSPALPGTMPFLGLTTPYPASYTPLKGGWTLDATTTILMNGKKNARGIMWQPATTNPDTARNQWLFSDCLDFEAGIPYRMEMSYVSYGENFDMQVKLGQGVNAEDMEQLLSEKITLRSDSALIMSPLKVILEFIPEKSGVQNIGFRQMTSPIADKQRTPLLIWAMKLTKLTPTRIELMDIKLPESSCNLTATDSVTITLKNTGYTAYADSFRIGIKCVEADGQIIEKEVMTLVSMKARMGESDVYTYTLPFAFDLSREGVYKFSANIAYRVAGEYIDLPIPKYVISDSGKVVSYYPLNTPIINDFSKKSAAQNWKDITANTQSNGEWFMHEKDDAVGRNKGYLEGIGIGTATNAWFRTSCISLSSDSIYEVSAWVKYAGQGIVGNKPTFKIGLNSIGAPGSFRTADVKVSKEIFTYTDWTEVKVEISVTESKSYYVGFNYVTKFGEISVVYVDDFTLKAIKAKENYTVTLSSNDENMGTVSGGGTFAAATSVTVKAMAKTAYEFANWTENGETVSTDAAYTFVIAKARTLQANFKDIPVQHTLSLSVNDTTLGMVVGGGVFSDSTEVRVVATPKSDKSSFVAWKNGNEIVSTDSIYTFILRSDLSLIADFKLVTSIEPDVFASVSLYAKDGNIYMEGLQTNTKLQIIDVTGRVMESASASGAYNFKAPQKGIYMVRLFDGNSVKTYKLSVR